MATSIRGKDLSSTFFAALLLVLMTSCGGYSSGGSSSGGAGGGGGALPSAPTGLSATAANAQISLTWSASASATSYHVKRAMTSGGPYTQIGSPTATNFIDLGLTDGTKYYYVVSALNYVGESANSSEVNATPVAPTTPPSAPTGLQASPGSAQVALSWNASTGATSYHVKRGTTGGGPYTQIGSPTATNYTDAGLTDGTKYYYVVSAMNSAGESANSSEVNATPVATWTLSQTSTPAAVPGSPTNEIDRFPFLIKAGNGTIFLFYDEMPNGAVNEYTMAKVTTDNGVTWSNYSTNSIVQLHINNIGSGYTSAPSVGVSGGGGSNAAVTASAPVNGAIPSISITAGGSGYQFQTGSDPYGDTLGVTCTISGGGGSGATCFALGNVSGVVTYIVLTAYGSGYTSTPSCAIGGSGAGATCVVGAPVNGAITSYTITNPGSNYRSAPSLTVTGGGGGSNASATPTLTWCLPSDPAGCFHDDYGLRSDVNIGGGVTPAGTLLICAEEYGGDSVNTTVGVWCQRSTDGNGTTWTNPAYISVAYPSNAYSSATSNIVGIPAGSPGVTGSCASGCIVKPVRVGGDLLDLIFSYDDGVTWTDEKLIVDQAGYDDETALVWAGGNKLMAFIRSSREQASDGGPTPLPVVYSSDMGTTWTGSCPVPAFTNVSQCTTPAQPNSLTPGSLYCNPVIGTEDQFTNPSPFPAPVGTGLVTLMFGDRFACQSPVTVFGFLRAVTFDPQNAFSTKTYPPVQFLFTIPSNAGNTTYFYAKPTTGNNVLVVFENGLGTNCNSPIGYTCEQIWEMTATYVPLSVSLTSSTRTPSLSP
jgi:hypothetical protein